MAERVRELIKGDFVGTPGGSTEEVGEPPWLDKKKFQRARELYNEHFASINFSHLCGLILSFYFTKNITTLRSTGMSETTKALLKRYLATVRHIQSWYEGNIWDKDSNSRKSIFKVRSMHTKVAASMSQRKDGIVYVSQWDMALTQWAFIGPMLLFPSRIGLHGLSDEDFASLAHFWRGVGHLLGIEDKYNLCHGTLDEVTRACRNLLNEHYKVEVCKCDQSSVSMGKSVILAFSNVSSMYSWGAISNYVYDLIDMPCPFGMGFFDKMSYNIFNFMMCFALKYRVPRYLYNELARFCVDLADGKTMSFEKIYRQTVNAIRGKFIST